MKTNELGAVTDMSQAAGLSAGAQAPLRGHIEHEYHVECFRDGELLWEDTFHNLVTTAGLNKYLDATLKTGLASPLWYVALIAGPGSGNTYVAGDTAASHTGWSEDQTYSNGTRPAFTPGTIASGSVSNSASKAVFNINGTATIAGCSMSDLSTKGGATGTLLGEGNFTAGDRLVQNGDTLNVTVTATQT
jgi:hypothetical protein